MSAAQLGLFAPAAPLERVVGEAVLSPDGRYRYLLTRWWGRGDRLVWIMLNPSTADADTDDPTLRRCIAFSRQMGAGSLTVVNLFALRATNPGALAVADDPIGPENAAHITSALIGAHAVIAAWGAHPMAAMAVDGVAELLRQRGHGHRVACLGVTKSGAPRHPLYVPGDALLRQWPGGVELWPPSAKSKV